MSEEEEIANLKKKIDRLWEENVRRREATELHKMRMEEELVWGYYFDRELWSVLDEP